MTLYTTHNNIVAVIGLNVSNNGIASEGMDRPLNLTVAVTSGELGVDIAMGLDLSEGTAKSMTIKLIVAWNNYFIFIDGSDFLINGGQNFTLGPNIGSHTLSIDIINDDIFEAEVESFAIRLSILNATELHGLQLGTQRADLTIQDDDRKLSSVLVSLWWLPLHTWVAHHKI